MLYFPPRGRPVNSVKVMRAYIVIEAQGKLVAFARGAFQADGVIYGSALSTVSRQDVLHFRWLERHIPAPRAEPAFGVHRLDPLIQCITLGQVLR